MKIQQSRRQLFVCYLCGFLAGIVYANLVSREYLENYGIFGKYFLRQFAAADVIPEAYFGYVLRVRLVPALALAAAACTRWRRAAAVAALVWTGFAGGLVLTFAVLQMGAVGILVCVSAMLPQICFYLPAAVVLFWYMYLFPQVRWNGSKTVFVTLFLLSGAVLEGYVSPVFLRFVLRTLKYI